MTNRFEQALDGSGVSGLAAAGLDTLQVNLGKLCNQACRHCHVDAGPHRTGPADNMGEEMVGQLLEIIEHSSITILDLTGGAPELNPNFRRMVVEARGLGVHVVDRCNLSVLFENGQEDLAEFLADHRVEIVASLPYHKQDRTDRQRGGGVFDASIFGLQKLNALGYGRSDELQLNLVSNPVGAYLPGDQLGLEAEYKLELLEHHGIEFHNLYCITNMPIARFRDWLEGAGILEDYMQTLADAFNPGAVCGVMCRQMISIAPDGSIHDCDFNQMLGLPVNSGAPSHVRDFDYAALSRRKITTADHCLGCTAGAGSSCGGTLTEGA